MLTSSVAVILLFLFLNTSVAQEQPSSQSPSSGAALSTPAKELNAPQSTTLALEPLDPALELTRDKVEDALDHLDNKKKFDWLRRKRNEVQLTEQRQVATLASLKDDIGVLRDRVSSTEDDIQYYEHQPDESYLNKKLDALNKQEESINSQTISDKAKENQLNDLRDYKQSVESALERAKQSPKILIDLKKKLSTMQNELTNKEHQVKTLQGWINDAKVYSDSLEEQVAMLLIPATEENKFKLWITAAFTALVLVVIMGFFVVSWRDETVRRSIFSSQSGIQFLTLFSLVIAIILFGILDILEAKELAALLGGLSGYILGRVTNERERAHDQPPASTPSGGGSTLPVPVGPAPTP